MALHRLPLRLRPLKAPAQTLSMLHLQPRQRRAASTVPDPATTSQEPNPEPPAQMSASSSSPITDPTIASELAGSSHDIPGPSAAQIATYAARLRRPNKPNLPPSRYRFRPPKYYRGPLHPHQPPPTSSPASRVFIPGPFSLPRFAQTYAATLAPDLMTLQYNHIPPLPHEKHTPSPRLRAWTGDSPYFPNRPLRRPRGTAALPLVSKPITFANVPTVNRITVSSIVHEQENSAYLHVAGMVLQSMTGVRARVSLAKRNRMFGGRTRINQRAGRPISVTCELRGEGMWHFLSTMVEVVGPGIKEWKGLRGSSGDGSGNVGVGFAREVVGAWPEVGVNYDAYPPRMIPGVDIIIHTTATNDRHARLLLSGMGLPFYGKHVN